MMYPNSVGPYGTFTVFPTCARFTGEFGLADAVRWAKRCAAHGGTFVVVNEFGSTVGSYEGRLITASC
jgi:hypothetical protein